MKTLSFFCAMGSTACAVLSYQQSLTTLVYICAALAVIYSFAFNNQLSK
jgi:hypothetical protein